MAYKAVRLLPKSPKRDIITTDHISYSSCLIEINTSRCLCLTISGYRSRGGFVTSSLSTWSVMIILMCEGVCYYLSRRAFWMSSCSGSFCLRIFVCFVKEIQLSEPVTSGTHCTEWSRTEGRIALGVNFWVSYSNSNSNRYVAKNSAWPGLYVYLLQPHIFDSLLHSFTWNAQLAFCCIVYKFTICTTLS